MHQEHARDLRGGPQQGAGKRNLALSNGYGKLKEQTFRIAHMGDLQMSDIDELLAAIEDILKLK